MAPSIYQQRRTRVTAALNAAGGGVAIVPTAPERQRNSDSDHPYRYDSNFHYLTGFAEPGSWLVLTSAGRVHLFCREKNVEREMWDGHRLGPQQAPGALGVDEAYAVAALDEWCRSQLASFKLPRAFIRVAALPRTALGKVQKHLLPPWPPR